MRTWSYFLLLSSTRSFIRPRFFIPILSRGTMMSTTAAAQHDTIGKSGDVSVMTYNMLEQSLAFGAIPWVMIIPQALKQKCLNFEFVKSMLTKEYTQNWHKNKKAGNYKKFRFLFGDVLPNLPIGSSLGEFGLPLVKYIDEYVVEVNGIHCMTLHGILRKHLIANSPQKQDDVLKLESIQLANEIFAYLAQANIEVFSWNVRGPRIFDLLTNGGTSSHHVRSSEQAQILDRFYGSSSTPPSTSSFSSSPIPPSPDLLPDLFLPHHSGPDIIILQEYDAHVASETCPALSYGGLAGQSPCGFGEAMTRAGYHSLLFEGPKQDGCGFGIFVKASRFRIASSSSTEPIASEAQSHYTDLTGKDKKFNIDQILELQNIGNPIQLSIPVSVHGDKMLRETTLGSFDFFEQHHPVGSSTEELVPLGDRKHFGVVVLEKLDRHLGGETIKQRSSNPDKDTGAGRVVVLGTHLMTTSRDRKGKVVYPGEIRAYELSIMKKRAKEFISNEKDVVILGGDFNINMRIDPSNMNQSPQNEKFVFEGVIPNTEDENADPLVIDTGYHLPDAQSSAAIKWECGNGEIIQLSDTYEKINQQPYHNDQDQRLYGSSHNAARVETIDYIWYCNLKLMSRSPLLTTMPDGTPDAANPSDHIPLIASYEFVN